MATDERNTKPTGEKTPAQPAPGGRSGQQDAFNQATSIGVGLFVEVGIIAGCVALGVATAGLGGIACAVAAGALSGAAMYGVECSYQENCNGRDAAISATIGGIGGGVGAGIGGAIAGRMVGRAGTAAATTNSRLLWTSWQNYPKVTVGGRDYAQIGNCLYTHHAVDRMQPSGLGSPAGTTSPGRGMSPVFVEDVIATGTRVESVRNGVPRTTYTSGTAQVVT